MNDVKKMKSAPILRSQFATSRLVHSEIASKIVVFRGVQVMLDRDLAELYEIDTKVLKQSVKRNIERFPEEFCFELDKNEFENLRSQIVTSSWGGLRYAPFAFTEQGVAMLSAVLRSEKAIKVSIEIMNAFVLMRHYLHDNMNLVGRLTAVENKVDSKFKAIDENFSKIFKELDSSPKNAKEGVFFKGQIFDAYAFFQNIIRSARKEIVLIDGYVDLSILERLKAKQKNVSVQIYTDPRAELKQIDVDKFNEQYPTAVLNHTKKMHDRFLIIDNKDLYHIGASLKDLGKACFAFDKMDNPQKWLPVIFEDLR